jgi:hypothetical protein
MYKIITPQSLESSEPTAQLVKLAHAGLVGDDLKLFQKRGAAVDLLKQAAQLRDKVASDETLIHLIAMGSTESTGPNRNGDGFRAAVLRQYYPTFEKYAHFYRDHLNTDPRKSYGRVVTAAYNEPMQRVELLVALSNNKAAADRNKGLVADKELAKLASGQPLSVSMACSVGYDLCSYCGNKAPTVKDYCRGTYEGGHCKAGGLRHNIGALVEIDNGLHHLHADNPHPRFFDISHVGRNADRIAYVTGQLKAASARGSDIIKSAEIAAALCMRAPLELQQDSMLSKVAAAQLSCLYMLADQESLADRGQYSIPRTYSLAFSDSVQNTDRPLPQLSDFRYKVASAMRALADARVLLPISRFIELFTATSIEKTAELTTLTQLAVPGMYTKLTQSDDCETKLHNNPYLPAKTAAITERAWAQQLVPTYSVRELDVQNRVRRASLHSDAEPGFILAGDVSVKTASANEAVAALAEQYCLYKLAFLQAIPETELPLTAALTIMQNYIA